MSNTVLVMDIITGTYISQTGVAAAKCDDDKYMVGLEGMSKGVGTLGLRTGMNLAGRLCN